MNENRVANTTPKKNHNKTQLVNVAGVEVRLWKEFHKKAALAETDRSKIIRGFIRGVVEGRIDIEALELV